MNRKSFILLGICMCAIALSLDLTGTVELGNLALGFAAVLFMFSVALTFAILAERKEADG
ncbi:MAG: hypothetical protein AAF697_01360 [Pseudomonadota bacterium]